MPDEGAAPPSGDLVPAEGTEVTEEADSEDSDHDDDPVEWRDPQFVWTKNPSLEELKPTSEEEQDKKDVQTYYENVKTCAVGEAKSWVVQAMLESRAKWASRTLSGSEWKQEYMPDLVVCCKNYFKWKTSKFEGKTETNESISQLCRKLWVKDSDDQIRARREQFIKKMEEPAGPGDNMWDKLSGTAKSTTKKFKIDTTKKMYNAVTGILDDGSLTQKTWERLLVDYQKQRRDVVHLKQVTEEVKQREEELRDEGMLHTAQHILSLLPAAKKACSPDSIWGTMQKHKGAVLKYFRKLNRMQLMHLYVALLVKGKLASAKLQEAERKISGRESEFSELGLIRFLENYPTYPMNLRVKYINKENGHFEWHHNCSPSKDRKLSGLMIGQNKTLDDANLWGTVRTEMTQWCDAVEKDNKATLVSTLFDGVECGSKGMVRGEFAFFKATGVTEAFYKGVGGDIFSKHELDSVHIRMVESHKRNDSKCNIELRWGLTDDKVERGLSEEKYDVPKYRYNLNLHTPEGAASKRCTLADCLDTATTNIVVWKDMLKLDEIKKSLDEEDKFTYCLLSRLKSTWRNTFLTNKPGRDAWLKSVVDDKAAVQPASLFYFNLPDPSIHWPDGFRKCMRLKATPTKKQ